MDLGKYGKDFKCLILRELVNVLGVPRRWMFEEVSSYLPVAWFSQSSPLGF